MTIVEIPRVAGSRRRAEIVSSDLPPDLSSVTVEVFAAEVTSASQSFADELCTQILVERHALRLVVHDASPRFANYLNTSARLRDVAEHLSVDVKP